MAEVNRAAIQDAVAVLVREGRKRYTNPEGADPDAAIGLALVEHYGYRPDGIFTVLYSLLEDCNYHTVNRTIELVVRASDHEDRDILKAIQNMVENKYPDPPFPGE